MNWRDQLCEPVAPEHMFGEVDPSPYIEESCAERSARLDGSWRVLEAQYGWTRFCWELWRYCNAVRVYGKLPDALGGDK